MRRIRVGVLSCGLVALSAIVLPLGGCDGRDEAREAELQAEIQTLQDQNQALAQQSGATAQELEALKAEKEALSRQIEDLGSPGPLEEKLAAAEGQIATLEGQLAELKLAAAAPTVAAEAPAVAAPADQDVRTARDRLKLIAAVLFDRGDYPLAEGALLSAYDLGADDPETLFRIGYVKSAVGEHAAACEWYQVALDALEEQPAEGGELLVKCLNNYGAAKQRLGAHAEAGELYRRAIEQDAAYAPAHFNLGLLYAEELNKPADAIEALRKHIAYGGQRSETAKTQIQKLQATP